MANRNVQDRVLIAKEQKKENIKNATCNLTPVNGFMSWQRSSSQCFEFCPNDLSQEIDQFLWIADTFIPKGIGNCQSPCLVHQF